MKMLLGNAYYDLRGQMRSKWLRLAINRWPLAAGRDTDFGQE